MHNKWERTIEFWFECVKEGYIVVFSIECSESFSSVERIFASVPRRILVEEILLWIEMLVVEKGLMHMKTDKMVE
jgi:hypothetical protein